MTICMLRVYERNAEGVAYDWLLPESRDHETSRQLGVSQTEVTYLVLGCQLDAVSASIVKGPAFVPIHCELLRD